MASRLPDVTILRDDEGREAQRFGSATSGQTYAYAPDGTLAFSGGITGARGHAGDNAGRASLVEVLNDQRTRARGLSVYGCPLFGGA
jgi:hypothetical protein